MRVKSVQQAEVENDTLMTDGAAFVVLPQTGSEHGHDVFPETLT